MVHCPKLHRNVAGGLLVVAICICCQQTSQDIMEAKEVGDIGQVHDLQYAFGVEGDMFDLRSNKDAQVFISVGSPLMDALTVEYLWKTMEL